MLLVTAGLFAKSLAVVQRTNLGFDPTNIVNVTMDPSEVGYDEARGLAFYKALVERLRSQPGVQSVALTSSNALSNYFNDDYLKVSDYENPLGRGLPLVSYSVVSPGYLQTLRIPMIRGRNFTDHDTTASQNAPHLVRSSLVTDPQVKYFNERRFAVLLVDADQNSLFAVCHLRAAAKGSSDSSVAGRGRRRRVSALSGRRHASVDRVSTGAERIIS
jgi:hypothetical protein